MLNLSMISPIRFSLVVPFGGNSDLLVKTIESVIDQSYIHWDLMVIDDGTKLDLESILKSYLNRITLIVLPNKVGIVSIFDLAIDNLTGDVGMILGADDLLERDFLLEMASAWKHQPGVVLIHPKVITIDENSVVKIALVDRFKQIITPTNFRKILKGRLLLFSLVAGNWMYFTSSTFKVSALKSYRFNSDFQIAMDWELAIRMAFSGEKFGYAKKAIFFYRRHTNSFSMREDTTRLRLSEEIKVVRSSGDTAKGLGKVDIWLASKMHVYSYVNFYLRKFMKLIKSNDCF